MTAFLIYGEMEQLTLFGKDDPLRLPLHLMEYHSGFFSKSESLHYLEAFIHTIPWQQHKVILYEKEVLTPRMSAWFGDLPESKQPGRQGLAWTPELLQIKDRIEFFTKIHFNGVLLNYYRDGRDSVAWHSDKDTVPGMKTAIASISFGQVRDFDFRKKSDHRQRYSLPLENGSLLLMKCGLQQYWEHRIAKSNLPLKPRINLTFRIIGDSPV